MIVDNSVMTNSFLWYIYILLDFQAEGEDQALLNTSNEILAQYYQRILAHCKPCK